MKNKNLPLLIAFFAIFTATEIQAQDYKAVVQNYLSGSSFGRANANKDFVIDNVDPSKSLNASVVNIKQTHNGIPIYGNEATLLVKDEQVINFVGEFTQNIASKARVNAASPTSILTNIISELNLSNSDLYLKDLASGEIRAPKLVYYDNGNDLILCYVIEFHEKKSINSWQIVADAVSGKIYSQVNLTQSCNFGQDSYGREHVHQDNTVEHVNVFPQKEEAKVFAPFVAQSASYRVFELPIEAPTFGSRTLVSNPWDLTASPNGWQTIGTTNYTNLRGNNAHAYTDEDSDESNTIDTETVSATYNYDFPMDLTQNYNTYKDAAVTNLFYMNNKIHDILYKFGFTETARNFQADNLDKGGIGNDYVFAEARDGADVADLSLEKMNNANFSSFSEGTNGRMQMYMWQRNVPYFTHNAPVSIAGTTIPQIGLGYFGAPLWKTPVTADVKIAAILDACTALPAASLAGKIGIAQRGTCNFTVKVKNMEDAGAVAAIIYNTADAATNPGEAISNMSGDAGVTIVTIPSVFLPQSRGEAIVNLINGGDNVNVSLQLPLLDGSLDNGIIAHEYGHGLSNRTTGTGAGCLNTTGINSSREQMGEGWSDFVALMTTLRPTDGPAVPRSIGTFASDQGTTGAGIRLAKYSPDFAINNYTYGNTTTMGTNAAPLVHSIGFVWATILWDLHWKYVEKYGFNSDILANADSGSARVFQTVLDGIKLQGCSPTFVMGRNGILAADQAKTGGADKCMIWNVFAKRGVGLNASAGSKLAITDNIENFDVPADCALSTNDVSATKAMSIYPNPAKNEFFLKSNKSILGKLTVEIFDASGKLVSSQKAVADEAVNTQALPNGVYVVKVTGLGVEYSSKLMIKK